MTARTKSPEQTCFICGKAPGDRRALLSAMSKPNLWGRRLAKGKDLCEEHQVDLSAALLRLTP